MNREKAQFVLERELDRRLADVARRLDGAVSRAGIVIAAALVVAVLPGAPTPGRWLPLGFALGAVILAALALVYRNSDEVPIRGLLERANEHTAATMGNEIFDRKLSILRTEEMMMNRRARQLTLSYATLAIATASVVLIRSVTI